MEQSTEWFLHKIVISQNAQLLPQATRHLDTGQPLTWPGSKKWMKRVRVAGENYTERTQSHPNVML